MGGEVFVGVKDMEGREHLSLRWTNGMPSWLGSADFYLSPGTLLDFLSGAKPDNKWPKAVLVDHIEPSEYGVIFVDFPTKSILSRQDYHHPWEVNGRCLQPREIQELWHSGWIIGAHDCDDKPVMLDENELRAGRVPRRSWLNIQPKGWTLDYEIERAHHRWPEVTAWLKDHGWTSPIRPGEPS